MRKSEIVPLIDSDSDSTSEESFEVKLKYPRSSLFIAAAELCNGYGFSGIRSILAFYIMSLNHNYEFATEIFHAFLSLCFIMPIFGAILADSYLGKYHTILYLGLVYVLGNSIVAVGAIGDNQIPGLPSEAMTFIGLILIAMGMGGVKPCLSSFGGDQFQLPEQETELKSFFLWFCASANVGSLASEVLTPYLRTTSCLGKDTCFVLPFTITTTFMAILISLLVLGKTLTSYKINIPFENVVIKTVKCIWHGMKEKFFKKRCLKKGSSILDHSIERFGQEFVDDVKALSGVFVIFLPLPLFWALFHQQATTWTFQATRMKSRVGETFEILPDIVNAANSLLFLIFVPTFEYIIYPNLSRMKLLRRPLQRIVVGGVLTGCAYLISGYLELRIQQSHSTLPKANEVMYTFYNGFNFDCSQRFPNVTLINPESRKIIENIHFGHGSYVARRNLENSIFSVSTFRVECDDKTFNFEEQYIDRLSKGVEQDEAEADSARSVIFTGNANGQSGGTIYVAKYPDKVTKSRNGFPFVKFFWSFNFVSSGTISIVNAQNETIHQFAIEATQSTTGMSVGDFPAVKMAATGLHRIHLKIDANLTEIQQRGMDFFDFQFGGNYNIILKLDLLQGVISSSIIFDEITKSNEIHMLWQLPQYIFLTAGEIMLSISSISFAFTEAPQSMKAVVMSMQNLTMAMGDILVVLLTPMLVALFQNQASTFFCFGFLMLVDMLIMAYMANNYQYKNRAT